MTTYKKTVKYQNNRVNNLIETQLKAYNVFNKEKTNAKISIESINFRKNKSTFL